MLKRRQETTFELIPESNKLLVIPGIQAILASQEIELILHS